MSEKAGVSEQPGSTPAGDEKAPHFGVEKIYVKDMSLEIPGAPQIFLEQAAPQIEISMHNSAAAMLQAGLYEAVLTVTVTAKLQDRTAFLVEVAQAGIFQVLNLPRAETEAVLGVLCPNTLLPYARETVASVLVRAGFPPVLLQHVTFEAAYQERLQQLQSQAQPAAAAT